MVLDAESPVRESETREGLRRAIDRVHGEKEKRLTQWTAGKTLDTSMYIAS